MEGGGFLIGADDVVQPFNLPKAQFHAFDSPASTGTPAEYGQDNAARLNNDLVTHLQENGTYDFETIDDDHVVQATELSKPALNGAPKTMREIAEDAAREQDSDEFLDNEDISLETPTSSATKEIRPRRTRAAIKATSLKKRGRANSRVTSQDDSPSPAKRGRRIETPTSGSVTGRVLRPRVAKNTSNGRAFREAEE